MSVLPSGRKHLRSIRTRVCETAKVLQLDPAEARSWQVLMVMFIVAPRHLFDINSHHLQELVSLRTLAQSQANEIQYKPRI